MSERVVAVGAIIAAGIALGTVLFTAGDASQRLTNHGWRLDTIDSRLARVEGAQGDTRVILATLQAQMDDIQQTVHRVDGTPVPKARRSFR